MTGRPLTIPIAGIAPTRRMMEEIAAGLEQAGHLCPILVEPDSLATHPDWAAADIAVSILAPVDAAAIAAAPGLRAIVSPLLGYEWIDLEAATVRGIAVANGEVEENRESMAEATVLMLLALLYRLPDTMAQLQGGAPPQRFMLKGKTVGVIGYGGIARTVLGRLQSWGCDLLVHSRWQAEAQPGLSFVPLDTLLANSDAVLVLTSHDRDTHHLLDAARLARMKPSALLVNTARGAIIDEAALIDALEEGRLAGAALDVFESEPLPQDSPLRRLSNVILTPHAIGHTQESLAALPVMAIRNVLTLAGGELPASLRNPAVATRWRAE